MLLFFSPSQKNVSSVFTAGSPACVRDFEQCVHRGWVQYARLYSQLRFPVASILSWCPSAPTESVLCLFHVFFLPFWVPPCPSPPTALQLFLGTSASSCMSSLEHPGIILDTWPFWTLAGCCDIHLYVASQKYSLPLEIQISCEKKTCSPPPCPKLNVFHIILSLHLDFYARTFPYLLFHL